MRQSFAVLGSFCALCFGAISGIAAGVLVWCSGDSGSGNMACELIGMFWLREFSVFLAVPVFLVMIWPEWWWTRSLRKIVLHSLVVGGLCGVLFPGKTLFYVFLIDRTGVNHTVAQTASLATLLSATLLLAVALPWVIQTERSGNET
jgi:hypothetical protein